MCSLIFLIGKKSWQPLFFVLTRKKPRLSRVP